jgi:hypothetical protein
MNPENQGPEALGPGRFTCKPTFPGIPGKSSACPLWPSQPSGPGFGSVRVFLALSPVNFRHFELKFQDFPDGPFPNSE